MGRYFHPVTEVRPMDRRTVLRGAGTLLIGATAGCLGSGEEEFSLEVVNEDFGPGPDGEVTVTVTVSNLGNEPQSGTLYVTTEINDESLVRVREVTLDAHETQAFEIAYDQAYDDVTSLSVESDVEPLE
jgi:hypothetical protein